MPDATATTDRVREHRRRFPALSRVAYFNYGAQGPLPDVAASAIRDAFRQVDDLGTFSTEAFMWSRGLERRLRTSFAHTIGARDDRIAIVENVTAGCAAVVWGFDWHPGDHIVTTDGEYPGISALIREVAHRFSLAVTVCPVTSCSGADEAVDRIASELRSSTRLVVASHVLWHAGLTLPLDRLVDMCRRAAMDCLLFVDGAQAAGAMPIDVARSNPDFYCFPASKWLCGPQGVAVLYVSEAANRKLRPALAGWRGLTIQAGTERDRMSAARLEGGTPAFALYAGAIAALEVHSRWGDIASISARIGVLRERLRAALIDLDTSGCRFTFFPDHGRRSESGILTIRPRNSARRVALGLEAEGFLVKALPSPDALRMCVHYLTTEDEIDALAAALHGVALS